MSSVKLNLNKPGPFNGKRDFFNVNTQRYNIKQYFNLSQLSSPFVQIANYDKISYNFSYLTGSVAMCRYHILLSILSHIPVDEKNLKQR